MAVGQVVQIVITGNSDQAIASIEKLAASTEASTAKASNAFANFGKAATLGLVAAGGAIAAFGIKQAMEQETATAKLKTAINNTGAAYADYTDKIEAASKAGINLGFDDAEVANSLARLTAASHSAGTALKDMALAEDIARARHISLQAATDLLAKVETGHVALLGRLGIATKDAAGNMLTQEEAIRKLTAMFGGQASAYTQTFAGKIEVLKAQMGELAEKIGFVLIPIIEKMASGISGAVGFFEKNRAAAAALAVVVGGPLVAAMVTWIATQAAAAGTALLASWSKLYQMALQVASTISAMEFATFAAVAAPVALGAGILVAVGAAIVLIGSMSSLSKATLEVARANGLLVESTIRAAHAALTTQDSINILKLGLVDLKGKIAETSDAADKGKLGFSDMVFQLGSLGGASRALQTELGKQKAKQDDAAAASAALNKELGKVTTGTLAFRDATDKARKAVYELTDALFGTDDAEITYKKSLDDVKQAEEDLAVAIRDHGAASKEAKDAEEKLHEAQLHSAESAAALDKAHTELYQKILTGGQAAYDAEVQRINDLKAKYPEQAAIYDDELKKLQDIWWQVLHMPNTTFLFKFEGIDLALSQIESVKSGIATLLDPNTPGSNLIGVRPYASGGWVPGAGSTDSVPAMLTPGEFVVKKDGSNLGDLGVTSSGGDTFNIYTPDPLQSAAEVVRVKRTAAWLAA